MKPYFLTFLSSIILVSCSSGGDNYNGIDRSSTISLRPAVITDLPAGDVPTAKQVIERTTVVSFWNKRVSNVAAIEIGFNDAQRDVAQMRLVIGSENIVDYQGNLLTRFLDGADCILVQKTMTNNTVKRDTIGYIPSSVMQSAKVAIGTAFANGDYSTCYTLFSTAYTFIPTTGAIWREQIAGH